MNTINWLGIGTVTGTKNTDTKEIMVHMPTKSATGDGRAVTKVEQVSQTSLNAAGETETSTTMVSNVVPAIWKPIGEPNRKTAPDVREGSQVMLYQASGQTKIYWTTYGLNAETFRMETIVWGFSGNPNIDEDAEFDVNDYYTVTVDTRSGFFGLRTTQANKEKSSMEFKIDGGNGRLDFRGSNGSLFSVDDFNSLLNYTNKEGTQIAVDKKKALFSAADSLMLHAENSISILTKTLAVQCTDVLVKADTAKVAIPVTDWEGMINLKGDVNQTGDINQTGDLVQIGDTTSSGTVTGVTEVKTAAVRLNIHGHVAVRSGNDVSGPPLPTG